MDRRKFNQQWGFGTQYDRTLRDVYLTEQDRQNEFISSLKNNEDGTKLYKGDDKAREDYLEKEGSNYGFTDWLKDSWSEFFQSMNKAQADDMSGQKARAQEYLDLVPQARKYIENQLIYNDIDSYFNHSMSGADTSNDIKKLQQHFPNIDFSKGTHDKFLRQYQNKIGTDLLISDNKKAYETLTKMSTSKMGILGDLYRRLGIAIHDNKDTDFNSITGPMQDWFGDRVTDAGVLLKGIESASNGLKLLMLDKFTKQLQDVLAYSDKAKEVNEEESKWYEQAHKVSDYYKGRISRSQQDILNGGSMWTVDNVFFANTQQLGFSSSSWDKMGASMVLSMAALAATGGGSLAWELGAAGLGLTGAAAQYSAGQSENNAQALEDLQTRIGLNLKKDGLYESVIADGKRKYKGASDQEIIEKIAKGDYLPNRSKELHNVSNTIQESLAKSRAGINLNFERNQYAVATDAMVDGLLYGVKLPKGLGSGIARFINTESKFMPVKQAGKWVMERGGKGVGSAYDLGFKAGLGLPGGVTTGSVRAVYNVAKEGLRATPKSGLVRNAMAWAEREVNAGRHLVSKAASRFHLSDEVADNLMRKRLLKYMGKPLSFLSRVATSAYSESTEEGKQFLNGQEWIQNEDPDRVATFFDGVMRDASYGAQLIVPSLGVPFGIRWGLADKGELYINMADGGRKKIKVDTNEMYSNMSGGWLGGAMHNAVIAGVPATYNALTGPDRISISDALAQNAELGRNIALSRFTKGSELASKVYRDPKTAVAELDEFRQFNKERRRMGLSAIDESTIDEEERYMKLLINNANNINIKQQADAAGFVEGTKDWFDYISARTMYQDIAREDFDTLKRTENERVGIVNKLLQSQYYDDTESTIEIDGKTYDNRNEDAIAASTILGNEYDQQDNRLVGILNTESDKKSYTAKELNERRERELEHQLKAEQGNKTSKNALETMQDTDAERALEASVANTNRGTRFATKRDEAEAAAKIIAEIDALQELRDNIDVADKYSEKESHHDSEYFKKQLDNRIKKLKKQIKTDKVDDVLRDPKGFFNDQEAYQQLRESYQESACARINFAITTKLGELLSGTPKVERDSETGKFIRTGWHLSKAKDVLDKINKSIESEYELIDDVTRYYEREQLGLNTTMSEIRNPQNAPQAQPVQPATVLPQPVLPTPQPVQQPTATPQQPAPQPVLPQLTPQQLTSATPQLPTILAPQVQPEEQKSEKDQALDIIADILHLNKLDNNQLDPQGTVDPQLDRAGQVLIRSIFAKGIYDYVSIIKEMYDTFVQGGFTNESIETVIPFFGRWYLAESANPIYDPVADRFTQRVDMAKMNPFDIINGSTLEQSDEDEQRTAYEKYKQDKMNELGLSVIFDGYGQDWNTANITYKNGDKIGVIGDNYEVDVYTVISAENGFATNVENSDHVLVMSNGVMLSQEQIDAQYENIRNGQSNIRQQQVFDEIERILAERDGQVIGQPSAHDYFVREQDGKIHLYPRVHTVNGSQFGEEASKTEARNNAYDQILSIIQSGNYDNLNIVVARFIGKYNSYFSNAGKNVIERTLSEIPDLNRYIDILKQWDTPSQEDIEAVATALADLVVSEPSSVAVVPGEMADKIVRIFFDNSESLDYDTFNIKYNGQKIYAKNIMQKQEFEDFLTDLKKWKEQHKNLKISTKIHTIFTTIQGPNGPQRVAGQTDLIAIDEFGNVYIIDTKTSRKTFQAQLISAQGAIVGDFYNTSKLFNKYDAIRNTVEQYSMLLSTYMIMLESIMPNIQFAQHPLEILPIRLNYDWTTLQRNIENLNDITSARAISSMRIGAFNEPDKILLNVTRDIFGNIVSNNIDDNIIENLLDDISIQVENIDLELESLNNDILDPNNPSVTGKLSQIRAQLSQIRANLADKYNALNNDRSSKVYDNAMEYIQSIQNDINDAIENHQEIISEAIPQQLSVLTVDESINALQILNDLNAKLYALCDQWSKAVNNKRPQQEIRDIYNALSNMCAELKDKYENYKETYPNVKDQVLGRSEYLINFVELKIYTFANPQIQSLQTISRSQVHGGYGFLNYNTVDRRSLMECFAEDNPSISLSEVCGEPEFAEQAVVEVAGQLYKDVFRKTGAVDLLIPIRITYKGHVFHSITNPTSKYSKKSLCIRIADNQYGYDLLNKINSLSEQLQPGDKIILTDMDRTEGMPGHSGERGSVLNSAIVPTGTQWSDISMDKPASPNWTFAFGIAKLRSKNSPIEIVSKGGTLITLPSGHGTPGVINAVITPDYRNKSLTPEPLEIPIPSSTLSIDDIDFIIRLSYMRTTDPVIVTKTDGSKSNIGVTVGDLLDLILPYGVTIQQIQNMRDTDIEGLKTTLLNKLINIDENVASDKLSSTSANPIFKALAQWFNSRDNIMEPSVLFGSHFKFERSDFDNGGISGLAWMMKHGILETDVDKLINPRFSFNNAEIQRAQPVVPEDNSSHPIIGTTENLDHENNEEDDIYDDYVEIDEFLMYDPSVDNSTNVQDTELNHERRIRLNLSRILGDTVPVEVLDNYTRIIKDFPPGLAGRCFRDMIYVSTYATPGTEYHEAFHRVYRLLLSEKLRNKLDKAIKKAYAKVKGKAAAERADRRALNEFAADRCLRYFNLTEDIKFDIKKPFDFIRQHYLAYKHIGSARLYFLYMAMNRGKYRNKQILDENMESLRDVADNSVQIHGRTFQSIFNLREYNTMLQSFVYYICKAQSISPTGQNINRIDLSIEAMKKPWKYNSYVRYTAEQARKLNDKNKADYEAKIAAGEKAKRKPIVREGDIRRDKEGKYIIEEVEESVEQMMLNSCKRDTGKDATMEMLDNWDVVKMDLIRYMQEIGIDYKTEDDLQYEKMMLAGDLALDEENEGWLSILLKDTFESSQTTRASKGVKCFASMIKAYQMNDKGVWKPVRNECGFYKHMDYKDVLNMLYSDCKGIKQPSEMMTMFRDKMYSGNLIYRQIYEIVLPYYRKYQKGDADCEQFITQLFNNLACTQNKFKMINAHFDKKNKKYAHTIKNCGQDYEARELRASWGKMLMRGGNDVFRQNEQGYFDLVDANSVERLGHVYDTLEYIRSFFNENNMRAIAINSDQKPILTLNVPNLRINNHELDLSTHGGVEVLKRDLCLMLNYLGIQMSLREFQFMLDDKFGKQFESDLQKLNAFFNIQGGNNIQNLWDSKSGIHVIKKINGKWLWNINSNSQDPSSINTIHHSKLHKFKVDADNVYVNNPFVRMLSDAKYKYLHQTEDMSVLVTDNKRYYTISENNLISDVTDELKKGGKVAEMLNAYCYNIFTDELTNSEGKVVQITEGSLLLKQIKEHAKSGGVDLSVCTLSQFKSDEEDNEGHDYFDISEVEDYVAKATILQNGNIIFPTMSDKKTWVYIDGVMLPGIHYQQNEENPDQIDASNLDINEALQQLVEYARTELKSVEQTLKQLKELDKHPERKVLNFHKGSWVDITKNSIEDAVEDLIKYKYINRSEKDKYISQFNEKDKVLTANERGKISYKKDSIDKLIKDQFGHIKDTTKIKELIQEQLKNIKDGETRTIHIHNIDGSITITYHSKADTYSIGNRKYSNSIVISHNIPNGAMFGSFNGVYDREGNYISFNRVIDENGNFVSPEQNLEIAKKCFFEGLLSDEQRKLMIARAIDIQTQKELDHMVKLGLIKLTTSGYVNTGLDSVAIGAILRALGVVSGAENTHSLAIRRYAKDITLRSIMSINEVERVFSGNPAFFKYQFKKVKLKDGSTVTTLTNRKADEFKRLGGLISTGVNNNTEIPGLPEDGMYTCAMINDVEVGSKQVNAITKLMSDAEWRAAYKDLFVGEDGSYETLYLPETEEGRKKRALLETKKGLAADELRKTINRHYDFDRKVESMSIDEIKAAIKDRDQSLYNIIEKKIKAETVDAYSKKINVADGAAYISPEMTEWLLRMVGSYDSRVQKAFEILKDPKSNIEQQAKAYRLVTTKVIGALKYTAYGQRLSEDGITTIPYYNKMALFPVFKCISTGQFAKLHDQMQKQGVHMLMMESAVKVGAQGSQDWSADDSFKFNTFKQSFKYLRKQFNTDPHHQEDQAMGTQMVKVALASLIQDHEYIDHNGNKIYGHNLLEQIMGDINHLCDIGKQEIYEQLFDENKQLDIQKFSIFLHQNLTSRDADMSIIDSISLVPNGDGTFRMNHPLSAISRMSWLQSILASYINDRMVDVNTQGSAFYQRSIFGMEGPTVITDENMPSDINGGKDLKMIVGYDENGNDDGTNDPAKGAMDCVLSIDYFADLLKKAGLQNASFAVQKKALMDSGVIGPKAKANLIGYRIPTQAQSSIHPLRCVDVLPVIQHTIMLPKEFTKITGSDFDIDKIFIGSLDYDVNEEEAAAMRSPAYGDGHVIFTEKDDTANRLINNYITILKDPTSSHIAHRSIDNDTTLLTDLLDDIEADADNNSEYEIYDFYALRTHTSTKNDFLTGKTGIGPFALNNNSQILTTLYHVEFDKDNVMSKLDHGSLWRQKDDYGQSIMSWISALINAHVDIAKDPYISRLNVNLMTYNLVNLMVRTGYGENTFYFTTQPVMKAMADKYRLTSTEFMKDEGKSLYQIRKEAKRNAAIEFCGEKAVNWAERFLLDGHDNIIEDDSVENPIDMHKVVKYILRKNGSELRASSKGSKDGITIPDGKGGKMSITYQQYLALIYVIDRVFETPAQNLSDVVKYSKIDTKKQGKNISEQIAYAKGVASTFNDLDLLREIYGDFVSTKDELVIYQQIASPFNDGLRRMYEESFIKHKTHEAIGMFSRILKGQVIEASPAFQRTVSRIAEALGRVDDKAIQKISDAVATKLKSQAMLQYAIDNNINIPGLVTGHNTIYDRLLRILNSIHNSIIKRQDETEDDRRDRQVSDFVNVSIGKQKDMRTDFSHLRDVDGTPNNALLKLLIADTSESYNPFKHMFDIPDKFANLKFVRLFDALDISSSKTDMIIQAWEDLLNDPNDEVRKFAWDLCVYAFYTSGDQMGRTKMFKFVPNKFREESGYVQSIRNTLNDLQNTDWSNYVLNASFIDDVVLNNHHDKTFIRKVKLDKKNNPTDPDWVKLSASQYLDDKKQLHQLINYNGVSYTPQWPLMLTRSDYVDPKDAPMYIKVKRTGAEDDGFNRSYTIYKCIHRIQQEHGSKVKPVYIKVNPRGYKVKGYTYYEYGGANVVDTEFMPYADRIKGNFRPDVQNPYFNNQTLSIIVDLLTSKGVRGDELFHGQSERWVGYKTYTPTPAPVVPTPAAPTPTKSAVQNVVGEHEAYSKMNNVLQDLIRQIDESGIESAKAARNLYEWTIKANQAIIDAIIDGDREELNLNKESFEDTINNLIAKTPKELGEGAIKALKDMSKDWGKTTSSTTTKPVQKSITQLEDGKTYTAELIHDEYKKSPDYSTFESIAKIAFQAASVLHIPYTINNSLDKSGVNHKDGGVEFNLNRILNNTYLHETIHAVITYWLDNEENAPVEIKQAIAELRSCYEGILDYYLNKTESEYRKADDKRKKSITKANQLFFSMDGNPETYGLSSFSEFVAELSNPKILSLILEIDANAQSQQSILLRIINAIYYIIAKVLKYDSIEKTSYNALLKLMTTIDPELHKQNQRYFLKIRLTNNFFKNCNSLPIEIHFSETNADIIYDRAEAEDYGIHTMLLIDSNQVNMVFTPNDFESIGPGSLMKMYLNPTDHSRGGDITFGVITRVITKNPNKVELEWRLIKQEDLADNMYIDKFSDRIIVDEYQDIISNSYEASYISKKINNMNPSMTSLVKSSDGTRFNIKINSKDNIGKIKTYIEKDDVLKNIVLVKGMYVTLKENVSWNDVKGMLNAPNSNVNVSATQSTTNTTPSEKAAEKHIQNERFYNNDVQLMEQESVSDDEWNFWRDQLNASSKETTDIQCN